MKYIVVLLFGCSLYTMADERFEGTWVWSQNQCRDSNLSPGSARSISKVRGGFNQVASAKITMDAGESATFEYRMKGENTIKENGTYTIDGDRVKAGNEDYHASGGNKGGGFVADWVEDRLLLDAGKGYQIGCEAGDSDCEEVKICNSGEKFVLVFGRVDQ